VLLAEGQHGVSKRTYSYVDDFAFWRVIGWLRKHAGLPWKALLRRYLPGWQPTERGETMSRPTAVTVSRYRYRGRNIPTPWTSGVAVGVNVVRGQCRPWHLPRLTRPNPLVTRG
jgi:RNA-directed DNA polymerase